ncbi:MAG: single-stranded DNA-binding protein [Candidatus Nomurabacteria bacterium]|jgi:single-strand DNA-binding protein|nr:single-stranded DNA-binding protein [Candidatus Nomurabacteria bacterium]
MSFNKVILMGNLTRDPETRATNSGQSVTNFSLAVNRVWNDKDGNRQEDTAFIECEAWGGRGDTIAKYVQKGRPLLVEGRLRQDTWDDKDTGKKRSTLRVVVESFSFVGGAGGAGGAAASSDGGADAAAKDEISDEPINLDDIPF